MRTTVYRFFDESDRLVYLGISKNIPQRFGAHYRDSRWWEECARTTQVHYATREEALEAEAEAIRAERPLYNVQHNERRQRVLSYLRERARRVPRKPPAAPVPAPVAPTAPRDPAYWGPAPRLADLPADVRAIIAAALAAEAAMDREAATRSATVPRRTAVPLAAVPPLLRPGETSTARPVVPVPAPAIAPSAAPPAGAGRRRARRVPV